MRPSPKRSAALIGWKRLAESERGGLEEIVRWYLSPAHRDQPEGGCMTSCVAADLPRLSDEARAEFTQNYAALMNYLETLLPEGKPLKRQAAMAIYAGLLGTLQLARATNDAAVSDALLDAGIVAALRLAE